MMQAILDTLREKPSPLVVWGAVALVATCLLFASMFTTF